MNLPKVIYVMGMPGAGKGTQAEMLSRDIGYKRFNTGNALRQIALQDTPLGREVKGLIDNGVLISPALATKVVMNAIQETIDRGQGLVFDGTPRTLDEARVLEAEFLKLGYGTPLVLLLEVDKETMIERNSKRRICLNINQEFPINTPWDEEECVKLGGVVGSRPDDERDKFATRYEQFKKLTEPAIIQHHKDHPELYFIIDGMHEPHRVHASIMDILRQFEVA